ncbi:unnamed protein product [Polarella glacialis]|uniref:Phosphomevalonate kinase n=1 Tax=Polarella glacialis TaxID=89957 RepID=A0A813J0K3_POLGL|nr:unnamed protein product [Polarella glacialis]
MAAPCCDSPAAHFDLVSLETPRSLKEEFRARFYEYDLAERGKDPFVFARQVLQDLRKPILVMSDLRQLGDYEYLRRHFSDRLILIRLDAGEELRATRGYHFTPGVDDSPVECDLDDDQVEVPWTLRFENDGDDSIWPSRLARVVQKIKLHLR